uniref:Uncharacterized protein n=1 Tax=Arundo donax TaxID=35708 RepID=A0A0A9C4G4_ARUDO
MLLNQCQPEANCSSYANATTHNETNAFLHTTKILLLFSI